MKEKKTEEKMPKNAPPRKQKAFPQRTGSATHICVYNSWLPTLGNQLCKASVESFLIFCSFSDYLFPCQKIWDSSFYQLKLNYKFLESCLPQKLS